MGVLVITCPATGKDLYWNKDRREGSSRLRYAIEFFASLNTGKKNARRRDSALSSLKDLQSALGSLNDVATRENLMARLATKDDDLGKRVQFDAETWEAIEAEMHDAGKSF
jgi:CHAD domain-containing protein